MNYIKPIEDFLNEMAYTSYDKNDDVLPKEILDQLKMKLGFKMFKRLGSGRYGTAFKVSPDKVLKITRDLKEYEYAKKIEGLDNEHIANVYKTFYFEYDSSKYAVILKELCKVDEHYFDRIIDSFVEYTGKETSLSYISSEFLFGDITKSQLNNYFKKYKDNGGFASGFADEWFMMLMELKSKNIYIKDFNGANVGMKPNNKLCVIELGLGEIWWGGNKIKFEDDDYLTFQ